MHCTLNMENILEFLNSRPLVFSSASGVASLHAWEISHLSLEMF